ncbi:MAG: hypothetical protein SF053_11870 [Bacteroidia bacterium]|nr:hypothetical protein [Bacteroidia bacterium]
MDDLALHITLKKSGPPDRSQTPTPAPPAVLVATFAGTDQTVLLAPRGVWWTHRTLLVSDTGQNRVFIWREVDPLRPIGEPDIVLGQADPGDTGRNRGGDVSAATLQYPSGVWSDGQRLIIADAWNHRVLVWHQFPTRHGQPADVVIGQENFTANEPNGLGIGAAPSDRSLYWPYGIHCDGTRLWIADTGNRRVLYYDHIPDTHHAPATAVIGKPDFISRDYEHTDAVWPYSVRVSPAGRMAIADTQYFRVLVWHDWTTALTQPADVILGQADFEQNGANQYGLYPQAHTLNWCYDTCWLDDTLLVADTGNSRVLWFSPYPSQHNTPASNLIGKPDFVTGSENAATTLGTQEMMYWPFAISAGDGYIVLADTGNHRILFYQLLPHPES